MVLYGWNIGISTVLKHLVKEKFGAQITEYFCMFTMGLSHINISLFLLTMPLNNNFRNDNISESKFDLSGNSPSAFTEEKITECMLHLYIFCKLDIKFRIANKLIWRRLLQIEYY